MQIFKTTLTKKEQLTHDIYLLEFKLDDSQKIEFKHGQYMMLLCPQPEGAMSLRRLYSIASGANQKDTFELLVEIVPNGVASNYVLSMNLCDIVEFQGPAGMFTLREPNHRVFLATGTGFAPIRSMLYNVIHENEPTEYANYLFWGVPHLKDMYFLDELKSFTAKHPNFEFFICVSREENLDAVPEEDRKYFVLGRVTTGVEKKLGEETDQTRITLPPEFDYYLCGGRTVVESLRVYLAEKSIPREHIIFEKF